MNINSYTTRILVSGLIFVGYYCHANDALDIGGYIMLDADRFSESFVESANNDGSATQYDTETELRRARLAFKYQFSDSLKTKLQFNADEDHIEIKDAYIAYDAWNDITFTLGQQKEPFGMENLSSSRNLLTIERSISSDALAPGRAFGLNLEAEISKQFEWQIGYFSSDDDGDPKAITTRAIFQPWDSKKHHWHIGGSFSQRQLNGEEYRINNILEVHGADSIIEGKKIDAKSMRVAGVETLWANDYVTVMGEWLTQSVSSENYSITDTFDDDLTQKYEGGYVQVMFNPGSPMRKIKNGLLSSPSKLSDWGGWEFIYRISEFSLDSEAEKIQAQTLGINYYATKKLKFMANYISTDLFENDDSLDSDVRQDGDAISLRAQFSF